MIDIAALPDDTPLDAVGMTTRLRNALLSYCTLQNLPAVLGSIRRIPESVLKHQNQIRQLGKVGAAEVMGWGRHVELAHKRSKKRIVVNLSEWNLDGWPEALGEAVEVETSSYGDIEITLKLGDAHEAAAKKIAKEAIEAFIVGLEDVTIDVDGLRLGSSEFEGKIFVPWSPHKPDGSWRALGVRGPYVAPRPDKSLDDLIAWLRQECEIRGLPFPPPPGGRPGEGFAIVPIQPSRRMLDALYGSQPSECDMTVDEAEKAWQAALKEALDA